jgi:hypothetical protein
MMAAPTVQVRDGLDSGSFDHRPNRIVPADEHPP